MCEDVARTVHLSRQLGEPLPMDARRHRPAVRPLPERLRAVEGPTMSFPNREIWFLTGSQSLYGEDTLRQVAEQSAEIAARLGEALPVAVRWMPVLTDADAIRRACLDANARRRLHRRHRVDAHVLPGEDVDRRARRADQAAAPPAHAGERGAALGVDRHGLHEPQPGRPRRPRVRVHPVPARRRPQDRRRARQRPRSWRARSPRGRGPRRACTSCGGSAGPVRRQHARRRRHRGRQGRGAAAVRRLRQHLRRERPGRGRGRRRRTRTSPRWSRSTRTSTTSPRSCGPEASATSRSATGRGSSWGCGRSSTTAASGRSPRTSRTSAGCGSCPASPSSGSWPTATASAARATGRPRRCCAR